MTIHLKSLIILVLSIAHTPKLIYARQTEKITTKVALAGATIKTTFNRVPGNPSYRQGKFKEVIGGFTLTGQYEKGQRTGIWERKLRGKTGQQYNYSTHEYVLEQPSWIVDKITQLDSAGNPLKELQKRNPYLGGDQKMSEIIFRCFRYPAAAQLNNIQGQAGHCLHPDRPGQDSRPESNHQNRLRYGRGNLAPVQAATH